MSRPSRVPTTPAPDPAARRRSGPLSRPRQLLLLLAAALLFAAGLFGAFTFNQQANQRLAEHEVVALAIPQLRELPLRVNNLLVTLELNRRDGSLLAPLLTSVFETRTQMDKLLTGLTEGGGYAQPDGKVVRLRPIRTTWAPATLESIKAKWFPLQESLQLLADARGELDPEVLADSIIRASGNEDDYANLSNQLLEEEKRYAASTVGSAELFRNLCAGLVAGFPLLFLPLGFLFSRVRQANTQLEVASRELVSAKQDTDLIMQTVQAGLLLIDSDYKIGAQYSRELERILRLEEIAGLNFLSLLQRLLTEKMYQTTQSYFRLLFDGSKREKLVLDINPLGEVEVNFLNPAGGFLTKYLGFSFRRIVREGVVERLFVGIADITAQVNLEKELRDAEKRKEKQFDLLLGIMHVGPSPLEEFLRTAGEDLQHISEALRAEEFAAASSQGRSEDLRARLQTAFRCVHNIKGNAAYLQLQYFERAAEVFEDKIDALLKRPTITADDFLGVVILQSELRTDLTDLADLRDKAGGLLAAARQVPASSTDDLITGLYALARAGAQRQGKKVEIDADPFRSEPLSGPLRLLVKDVLIQLTRNALAHSIETPADRLRAGKPPAGRLTIQGEPTADGRWRLTFRDDGRGLDLPKIRQQALAQGLLTPAQSAQCQDAEIAPLIFMPGFSTAEVAGPEAGRGMGMEIIKQKVVDEQGGEIFVQCEPAVYCEFTFLLPLEAVPAGGAEPAAAEPAEPGPGPAPAASLAPAGVGAANGHRALAGAGAANGHHPGRPGAY